MEVYVPIYKMVNRGHVVKFVENHLEVIKKYTCPQALKVIELGFGIKDNYLFIDTRAFRGEPDKYYLLYLVPELEKRGLISLFAFLDLSTMNIIPLNTDKGQVLARVFNEVKKSRPRLHYSILKKSPHEDELELNSYNKPKILEGEDDGKTPAYPLGITYPQDSITMPDRKVIVFTSYFIEELSQPFFEEFKKGTLSYFGEEYCTSQVQVNTSPVPLTVGFLVKDGKFYRIEIEHMSSEPYLYWLTFFDIDYLKTLSSEDYEYIDYVREKFKRKPFLTRLVVYSSLFFKRNYNYDASDPELKLLAYTLKERKYKLNLDKEFRDVEFKFIDWKNVNKMTVLMNTVLARNTQVFDFCLKDRMIKTLSIVDYLNSIVECDYSIGHMQGLLMKIKLPEGRKLKPVWFPIYLKLEDFPGDNNKSLVLHHRRLLMILLMYLTLRLNYKNDLNLVTKFKHNIKYSLSREKDAVELTLTLPYLEYSATKQWNTEKYNTGRHYLVETWSIKYKAYKKEATIEAIDNILSDSDTPSVYVIHRKSKNKFKEEATLKAQQLVNLLDKLF